MPYRVLLSVVLFLLPSVARASTPTGQLLGHSMECIVDQGVSEFDIPTNPDVITALYFPKNIAHARLPRHAPRDFNIKWDRNAVYIRPHSARRDAVTNLVVKTSDSKMQVSLFVRRTDEPGKALRTCRFVHRDVIEAEQARLEAAVTVKTAELRAEVEAASQKQVQLHQIAVLRAALLKDEELRPVVREAYSHGGEVEIRLGHALEFEGQLWTSFVIDNTRNWRRYLLDHVQMTDRSGLVSPMPEVYVDPPATPGEANLAVIPPGARVEGFMRLPDLIQKADLEAITFRGSSGPHTLVASLQDPIWVWVPKREEEVERERRDRAALGVVSLYLQALAGFIWLQDGQDLDRIDATTLTGASVRAAYGLTSFLAIEAELTAAGTRQARFEGVALDGMQGELMRSAGLGRLQLGTLVRLGSSTVPFVRLGVGLQGGSINSTFMIDGNEEPGPESAFALDAFWYFGGGVERRFLEDFVAGIGLSAVIVAKSLGTSTGDGSIEAGAYLGYSWNH